MKLSGDQLIEILDRSGIDCDYIGAYHGSKLDTGVDEGVLRVGSGGDRFYDVTFSLELLKENFKKVGIDLEF